MKLLSHGDYHLFETQHGNKILVLSKSLYAWIKTPHEGEMLILTDVDHKVTAELGKGKFFLLDFQDDPNFRNGPHLFLQAATEGYREIALPDGLPSEDAKTVRLYMTENIVEFTGINDLIKRRRPRGPNKRHRRAG